MKVPSSENPNSHHSLFKSCMHCSSFEFQQKQTSRMTVNSNMTESMILKSLKNQGYYIKHYFYTFSNTCTNISFVLLKNIFLRCLKFPPIIFWKKGEEKQHLYSENQSCQSAFWLLKIFFMKLIWISDFFER